ncbi:MAG: universal stress protein [Cyclobacteriaceae bacterium]|nr:universal stress protein [Cyclobacteriaceae bacterium]MCH8515389.1 universal stress protein [Cyclobacteriaceae bacterium]
MKKILVPVDFSEESINATKFAAELAVKHGAELRLVHVIEYPAKRTMMTFTGAVQSDPMDNVWVVKMKEQAETQLQKLVDEDFMANVDAKGWAVPGSPYQVLAKDIDQSDIDLVVMGTRGASGLEEIAIGSNAEKMVRYAKCPVITVTNPMKVSDIKNILFATGLGLEKQLMDKLMEKVSTLQSEFDANLHILKVNTPNNFERDKLVKGQLRELIKTYNLKNASVHITSEVSEEEGILDFAKENNMDMIAMGTTGRSGIWHFLSGSIAEDIVNHAKRPVWTMSLKSLESKK